VGDGVIVYLKGHPELQGLLRYRGELPGQKGIQFGVELAPVRSPIPKIFLRFIIKL
jgi:hypothetical protein